jgi:uncharacterized membrane protein YgcG
MSNEWPDFLPEHAPSTAIYDLSKNLSPDAINGLNQVASSVTFKPIVVVLPKDYRCSDARELTLQLAKKWDVDGPGKNLLVVVDLGGHKVRAHGSPALNNAGVTSDYISNALIPKQFIPYMRQGDLATAIRLTILDVNRVQSSAEENKTVANSQTGNTSSVLAPATSTSATSSPAAGPQLSAGDILSACLPAFGVLAFFILTTVFLVAKSKQNINRYKWQELTPELDSLYRRADQLGEAADFLDTSSNVMLSHEIADFFAKLMTVQKSQAQVERLVRNLFRTNEARRALDQLRQYAEIMESTSANLLKRVNEATGGIESFEADSSISSPGGAPIAVPQSDSQREAISSQGANDAVLNLGFNRTKVIYRSPRWASDPAYHRQVDNDGLGDIARYLATTDRMQTVSYGRPSLRQSGAVNSDSWRSSSSSDGGGSWTSSSHSSGSSARSPRSSSSSSSSDGGGSWGSDSSSSDSSSSSSDSSSSSSDGGGSW